MNIKESCNYKTIEDMYKSDLTFISYFPKDINHSLELCLNKTITDLQLDKSLKFYEVYEQMDLIGYFIYNPILKTVATFFVHPNFRNKENCSKFWSLITKTIGTPFYMGMYDRNPRAKKFLMNMGGKEVIRNTSTDPYSVFMFEEIK